MKGTDNKLHDRFYNYPSHHEVDLLIRPILPVKEQIKAYLHDIHVRLLGPSNEDLYPYQRASKTKQSEINK